MLSRDVNGFTTDQVNRAFQGLDLPLQTRVRAELLNLDNVKLFDLDELHFKETPRNSQHSAPLGTYASIITAQNRLFHLRLNDASGNFTDFTGNARTFTAHGAPTYSQGALTPGDPLNNAIAFTTAATDYGDIADAAWMDVTPISISFWTKFTTTNAIRFMQRDETSNQAWVVGHTTTLGLFFRIYIGAASNTFSSVKIINDGTAHHVVCTYDGAYVEIYLDGTRVLKTAQTGNIDNVAARITVPGVGAVSAPCTIDEAGIVGRKLTPKEIRDEYQAGFSRWIDVNSYSPSTLITI